MHIETTHTYPVPRKDGFAYLTDLKTWADWSPLRVGDPEAITMRKGAVIDFVYRPMGIPMHGKAEVVKLVDGELLRLRIRVRGYTDVIETLEFKNAGSHAFTLIVTVDADEPADIMGKTYQWVRKPLLTRDVHHSLDRLQEVFFNGATKAA